MNNNYGISRVGVGEDTLYIVKCRCLDNSHDLNIYIENYSHDLELWAGVDIYQPNLFKRIKTAFIFLFTGILTYDMSMAWDKKTANNVKNILQEWIDES